MIIARTNRLILRHIEVSDAHGFLASCSTILPILMPSVIGAGQNSPGGRGLLRHDPEALLP